MTTIHWDIALTQAFQKSLLALTPQQQSEVNKTILNLQKGLNAPHLHALQGLPFRAFGVNQNALRIICHVEDNLLILLHANAHDPAYDWAKRHRVKQIGRYVRIIRTVIEDAQEAKLETPSEDGPSIPGPLEHIPDKHFRHFDIEHQAAAMLRMIPDEETLLALAVCFKPPVAEGLLGLATDPDALDIHVRNYQDALSKPGSVPSLAEAIVDDVNASTFYLPQDADSLTAALSGALENWRVYLHPSQRRLVAMSTGGAYKVTGGPGTGKTVVALHRARCLASEHFRNDPRPVLLTTFSRVLTHELSHNIKQLCGKDSPLLERIKVLTITRVAQDILTAAGQSRTFAAGDALDQCWDEAMKRETLGRPVHFYHSEREHIIARYGTWTEEEYLHVSRSGRGGRLNRLARSKVWAVISAFEEAMQRRGIAESPRIAHEAEQCIRNQKVSPPYAAVVCDELQDVSASELRLLAALAQNPENGLIRPEALFVVGDRNQSLYSVPIALGRCGIDVRGRSTVLRQNYRTTEGIRQAAIEVVADVSFSDEEDEGGNVLAGYVSLRRGPRPDELTFESVEKEADWIAEQAAQKNAALPLLVLVRTKSYLDDLQQRLVHRGLAPKVLDAMDAMSADDSLVLCTLHRSKGLEAPRVVIAGHQQIPQPWHGKGDEGDRSIWERKERCLLYVGMTRARDWCAITRAK